MHILLRSNVEDLPQENPFTTDSAEAVRYNIPDDVLNVRQNFFEKAAPSVYATSRLLRSHAITMCHGVWIVSLDKLLETTTSGGVVDAVDLERSLRWVIEVEDVTRTAGLNITYELTF